MSTETDLRDARDLAAARLEQIERLTARVEEQRSTIEGLSDLIRDHQSNMTRAHHDWRKMQDLRQHERLLRLRAEEAMRAVLGKPQPIAWDPATEDREFAALIGELLAWKESPR